MGQDPAYIDSSISKSSSKGSTPKRIASTLPIKPPTGMFRSAKAWYVVCMVLLLADIFFLNWKILTTNSQIIIPKFSESSSRSGFVTTDSCPSACLTAIAASKAESNVSVQPTDTPVPTSAPTSIPISVPAVTATTVKEFFVPLGGGTTTSSSWVTLSGLEAQVNSNNYTSIKSVSFEASLRLPTGNGRLYARLINLSDNTPLEETVVYIEGSEGQRRESAFSLRSGNKVYGVQIRSTLGFEGILDLARIKIVVN